MTLIPSYKKWAEAGVLLNLNEELIGQTTATERSYLEAE
jgi:hypothetical protein